MMWRRLLLLLAVLWVALPVWGQGTRHIPGDEADNLVYGIDVNLNGTDATTTAIHDLTEFQNLPRFDVQMWVDPYFGSDANQGTYDSPLRSFREIKEQCIAQGYHRCTVKGQGRVFSPRTLTVSYDTDAGVFQVGETLTWTTQASCTAGTGTVLGVGSQGATHVVAVAWASGADPVVTCDPTGGASGVQATVDAYTDTIVGVPSWYFAATDITVLTDVITAAGHPYVDGDGPFLFYNQTTMPTTITNPITEAVTKVYVCNVVANVSFQLTDTAADPACAAGLVDFTSQGVGDNQLIYYYVNSTDAGALEVSATGPIRLTECGDTNRICSLFESERPDWPWIIDGNGYYPNEVRYLTSCIGDGDCDLQANSSNFWPNGQGGLYNAPNGGLFRYDDATTGNLAHGWGAIQNGTVQNLALDGVFVASGGKLVTLNVNTVNIRNGLSDRSQTGTTNPEYQAHNSCFSSTGVGTASGDLGSVLWVLNPGDSSGDSGSDQGSGGCINPAEQTFMGIVGKGIITSDGISGDTNCGGTTCETPSIVMPSGDLAIVGPLEFRNGGNADRSDLIHMGGVSSGGRLQMSRIFFYGPANNGVGFDATTPRGFWLGPYIGGTQTVYANEIGMRHTGAGVFAQVCPVVGYCTTGGATCDDDADCAGGANGPCVLGSADMNFQNVVMDQVNANATGNYILAVTHSYTCGVGVGADTEDAVIRTTFNLEGVYDLDGTGGGACGAGGAFKCLLHSVGGQTYSNFMTSIHDYLADDDQWQVFEAATDVDSGGVGVNGDVAIAAYPWTCDPAEANCWEAATGGPYLISFSTIYAGDPSASCLPADVLGRRLCSVTLTPRHRGGR